MTEMTATKILKVSVIIAAAGRGARAKQGKNKLLAPLYGAPALYYTLRKFNLDLVDEVIVAAAPEDMGAISAICAPFGYTVVEGGKTRTQTVKKALEYVTGDIVLIHDGARPYVTENLIRGCVDSVIKFGSGVCAVPFTDTAAAASYGYITVRPERGSLYCLQTPQGFMTEDIKTAYKLSGEKEYTDDSAAYGEFIGQPRLCDGSPANKKLTYEEDFEDKNGYLPEYMPERIGFGADVHAFCEGDGIFLCGIKIPFKKGLAARSDGDVALHALIDATLSAAGLEDIGHYFPDDDPKTKGLDSAVMLESALLHVRKQGYELSNFTITIQAEQPKIAPYIDKMKKRLSEICSIPESAAGISAGTCEGLGFVGEGLGISAYCTALLKKV